MNAANFEKTRKANRFNNESELSAYRDRKGKRNKHQRGNNDWAGYQVSPSEVEGRRKWSTAQ